MKVAINDDGIDTITIRAFLNDCRKKSITNATRTIAIPKSNITPLAASKVKREVSFGTEILIFCVLYSSYISFIFFATCLLTSTALASDCFCTCRSRVFWLLILAIFVASFWVSWTSATSESRIFLPF